MSMHAYLAHQLQLLNDFFEMVVGGERVDLFSDMIDEMLPRQHRERGHGFAHVGQVRRHLREETRGMWQALESTSHGKLMQ
jgi:hypothetical protein